MKRVLRRFKPVGQNRDKVVILRDEARRLELKKNPLAFCFLLRSMFEISAKACCADHRISTVDKNGKDRSLADLLTSITNHLIGNGQDMAMVKRLHGARTELTKQDGVLVTSMNQLVHNPNFSITAGDICIMFHNIFPLLEEMDS